MDSLSFHLVQKVPVRSVVPARRVHCDIDLAIQYYHAIRQYLLERKSTYQAIVAFSGEHEFGGLQVSEVALNGFPSRRIADEIQQDP